MDFKDLQKVFGNDIFKVNRSLYYEMRQYIVAKEHFSTQEILTFFSQKYNLEEIKKCLYLFYVAQGKIIATVDNNFNYDFEYVKEAMRLGADEYVLKNSLDEDSLYDTLEKSARLIENRRKKRPVTAASKRTSIPGHVSGQMGA